MLESSKPAWIVEDLTGLEVLITVYYLLNSKQSYKDFKNTLSITMENSPRYTESEK